VKIIRTDSYRVSERVELRPGDVFRATGGPYWKGSDGTKHRLNATGPFRFISHVSRGVAQWIEATDKCGNYCVLHLAGRRRRIDPSIVTRPYRVIGKKRPQSQRLDNRRRTA
jgi:hypothetical protein